MALNRRVWTQQPQTLTRLNTANPLARGITHLVNAAGYEAVTGAPLRIKGTPLAKSVGAQGVSLLGSLAQNGYFAQADRAPLNAQRPWTMAALFELRADIFNVDDFVVSMVEQPAPLATVRDRAIGFAFTNPNLFARGSVYTTAQIGITGSTPLPAFAGAPVFCSVVVTAGGGWLNLYVNGRQDASPVAISNNGFNAYASAVFDLTGTSNYRVLQALKTDGVVWGAADAAAWHANPWQLFSPPARRIWVAANTIVVYQAARLDPVASSDAAAAAYVAAASALEASNASDSTSRSAIMLRGTIEAGAAFDIGQAGMLQVSARLEPASAIDVTLSIGTVTAAAVESAAGQDLRAATSVVAVAAAEAAGTGDLEAALATLGASLTDASSAADLASAAKIGVSAAVEAALVSDLVGNGPQYTVTRTEGVATADALSSAATLLAQLTEAAGTVDQATRAAQLVALITEPAVAADGSQAAQPVTYTVSITELVSALDLIVGALQQFTDLVLSPGHEISALPRILEISAAPRVLEIRA